MNKILFFAGLAEKMGQREILADIQGMTIHNAREWMIQEYPTLANELEKAIFAVNEEFVEEDVRLSSSDIVAIIPPVSGG